MSLGSPSKSPDIIVKEIDLTGTVQNRTTAAGAFVGNFSWGPVNEIMLIANEAGLVETVAAPTDLNTVDFHSAAYFLRYSDELQLIRGVTSAALNAVDSSATANAILVKNREHFDNQVETLNDSDQSFMAKYPGAIANGLKISVCPALSDSDWNTWAYKGSFSAVPGTSSYASNRNGVRDEVHVAVVDALGSFTGTPGSVLETYPFLSMASDAKNTDGSTNYAPNILNDRSSYVWMVQFDSDFRGSGAGDALTPGTSKDYTTGTTLSASTRILGGGVNSAKLGTAEVLTGFDVFEDPETTTVDFLIAPEMASSADQVTVVNDLISTAALSRADCVAVTSPNRASIINNAGSEVTSTVSFANSLTSSSYAVVDNNFLKVYDKYNDKYIYIPAASSTAGLMAATEDNSAPWFSPAGIRRGQYFGITALAYSPLKTDRDTLYKANVNPIVNLPGEGVVLYGDKTMLRRPSAFDRINVRRLFLVIERAISYASRDVLFQFNDEFTRAEFIGKIEPYLRAVQGRRGITEFRVICDETNNTSQVVDNNEFIATFLIKPARSINYITLNFVATRSGASFDEISGV